MIQTLRYIACLALLAAAATAAQAQTYPDRPIKLVVPWAPGGATDAQARLLAPGLERELGQPVVIDNRAGASGTIGTAQVAKAPPDGYTVLMGSIGPNAVSGALTPKLPYDPARDFIPVALTAISPNVLVVHPDFPAAGLQQMLALARKSPGKLDYASPGSGTSNHLAMELLKQKAGVFIVPVTYRGAGPALIDVLGNQVPMMFNNIDVVLPHIKAGKLKALAITGAKRSPLLPDVPTVGEDGLPGFTLGGWFGIFVPAATPAPVVARLHQAVHAVMASAELRSKLGAAGIEAGQMTQSQFASFVNQEIKDWTALVRAAGIKAD